jgi:hypothetical protein
MNTQKILNKAVYAAIFIALAAPATLKAQGVVPARFGVGASIILPSGEFGDVGGIGFGASVLAEWNLNDKMGIRGRAEYNIFGEKDWYSYISVSTSAMALLGEFVYRFNSHDTGWYVFAGAGLVNRTYTITVKDFDSLLGIASGGGTKVSSSGMGLGETIGGGYNFSSNLGVDACYTNSSGAITSDYNLAYPAFSYLQVTARWRF